MVDREKLIELLEEVPHPQRLYPDLYVDRLIANGVTVRERGRWITDQVEAFNPFEEPYLLDVLQCSVCGKYFDVSEARNFCPNCGADMRGEEDGKPVR